MTSGGLDKLDLYAKLDVPEVWFWTEEGLDAYTLDGSTYVEIEQSRVIPGLAIATIAGYAAREDMYEALQAFRRALASD